MTCEYHMFKVFGIAVVPLLSLLFCCTRSRIFYLVIDVGLDADIVLQN